MYSTKNFTAQEFACQHTGEHGIQKHVADKIQALRDMVGRPLIITSAYRSPLHPVEARKLQPGTHAQGLAVDIRVNNGAERYELIQAYRSPLHPVEARKLQPGTHAQGLAVDIRVNNGAERYELIQCGLLLGATGIGVNKTFIHLDWREETPVAWEY